MDEFEEFADSPEKTATKRARDTETDFFQIDTMRDTIESDRQLIGIRSSNLAQKTLAR